MYLEFQFHFKGLLLFNNKALCHLLCRCDIFCTDVTYFFTFQAHHLLTASSKRNLSVLGILLSLVFLNCPHIFDKQNATLLEKNNSGLNWSG